MSRKKQPSLTFPNDRGVAFIVFDGTIYYAVHSFAEYDPSKINENKSLSAEQLAGIRKIETDFANATEKLQAVQIDVGHIHLSTDIKTNAVQPN